MASHEPCWALHESPCTLARPLCIPPPPRFQIKMWPPLLVRVFIGRGAMVGLGGWGCWDVVRDVIPVQGVLVRNPL